MDSYTVGGVYPFLDLFEFDKMQIPTQRIQKNPFCIISLATIGVCVFGATASVVALFILAKRGNEYETHPIVCNGTCTCG